MKKIASDGWHIVYGISVLIENGRVRRGVRNNEYVHPYRSVPNGWELATGITLAALRAGMSRDTIRLL